MRRSVMWMLASVGAMAAGFGAISAIHQAYHTGKAGTVQAASLLAPSRAAADAVRAAGGGYATYTSLDHFRGVPVYDVHVKYHQTLWDVKVNMAGAIVQRKVASEQLGSPSSGSDTPSKGTAPKKLSSPAPSPRPWPVSSTRAGTIAVHAVGGGVVWHVSADHWHGLPVWDVHVLDHHQLFDVKVSQSRGVVMQKKLSSEQPGGSKGKGQDN